MLMTNKTMLERMRLSNAIFKLFQPHDIVSIVIV